MWTHADEKEKNRQQALHREISAYSQSAGLSIKKEKNKSRQDALGMGHVSTS